jgi:glucose/arabinose dehydrogenase
MQRRSHKKSTPFVLFATFCGVALGTSYAACSNSPTTGGPTGTAGAAPGTAGAVSTGGGGAAATAGASATAGSGTTGGIAAGGTSGGAPVGGSAGSGTGGGSVMGPACKAGVTAVNGSGLTVKATDISAFKFVDKSPGIKMAYDPIGKVVVTVAQNGTLSSFDPNVTLPTTASAVAVGSTKGYDSGGYAAEAGFGGDHRGIVFDSKGTLYILAVRGGGNVGVSIKKGVLVGTGPARTWTVLVSTSSGFPAGGTNFDHSFSGLAVSPDDASLFFSSGSRTDHGEMEAGSGEVPLSSAVFKVPTATPTDMKNDMAALAPVLFADGTRNAFDMAFNAAGDLIGVDNGPDMDLPDEINWLQQGKNYGFPYRFGGTNNPVAEAGYSAAGDKRLHPGYQAVDTNKYVADASLAPPAGAAFVDPIMNMGPDANIARADKAADPAPVVAGLAGITGHRSPLGIAFDTAGVSCGAYYKQGLVLSYGSVKADALGDEGRDLLLLTLTKAGDKYTMTSKQIAKGIESPMDGVLVGNKFFTIGYGGAPMYVFALPTP